MKNMQESEIEFELDGESNDYPVARSIVIRQYGGTAEECIKKARKEFGLSEERWNVIRFEDAEV